MSTTRRICPDCGHRFIYCRCPDWVSITADYRVKLEPITEPQEPMGNPVGIVNFGNIKDAVAALNTYNRDK